MLGYERIALIVVKRMCFGKHELQVGNFISRGVKAHAQFESPCFEYVLFHMPFRKRMNFADTDKNLLILLLQAVPRLKHLVARAFRENYIQHMDTGLLHSIFCIDFYFLQINLN
jgi:hypothetical protein